MTARYCVAGLVLIQVAALVLVSGAVGMAALLTLALVVATLGVRVPWASRLQTSPPYVILAVLSVMKLAVSPYAVPPGRDFVNTKLTLELATYCMISQILILFGWPGRRLPMAIPFIAGISLVSLYNVDIGSPRQWSTEMSTMLALAIAAAILSAVFFRRQRRRLPGSGHSRGFIAAAIGLAVVFGVASSLALNRYESTLERALLKLTGWDGSYGTVGFTHQGTLTNVSNWRRDGNDRVAVRVFAPPDQPPGYLKGRTFAGYTPTRRWNVDGRSRPKAQMLAEPSDLPPRNFGEYLFELDEPNEPEGRDLEAEPLLRIGQRPIDLQSRPVGERVALELWPARHLPSGFLSTIGSTHLAAETPTLSRDAQGNLDRDKENAHDPYTLYVAPRLQQVGISESDRKVSDERMAQYLQRPPPRAGVADAINQLSPHVFAGARTFEEKLAAVARYFRENYRYELGKPIDSSLDPVVDFLENRTAGHCELFASATVMLLRSQGVPARYCTGLVAVEWNEAGGYWIARDRDAHAWVEAFDRASGRWVEVDPTPSVGVPQPATLDGASSWTDWLRIQLRRWNRDWETRDFKSEMFDFANSIAQTQTLLGIAIATGLLAIVLRWRQPSTTVDPRLSKLRKMLDGVENRLARTGLNRQSAETLSDFAARVRAAGRPEAADWLVDYTRARYRPLPADVAEVPPRHTALVDALDGVKRSLRAR